MFVRPFQRHHLKVVLVVKNDFNGLYYQIRIQNSIWYVYTYFPWNFSFWWFINKQSEQFKFIESITISINERINLHSNPQREQLASHEAKVAQLGNELVEHKRNAPPSKGLQLQNYIEKDMYLQYEVST